MLFKDRLSILYWPSHFGWVWLTTPHPALSLWVSWRVFTFTCDLVSDLFNFSWEAGIGLTCCCINLSWKTVMGKEGEETPLKKKNPVKNCYDQFVRAPQSRTLSGSAVLSAGWHTLLLTYCEIEIASSMETEGAAAFQIRPLGSEEMVNSVPSSFMVQL